MKYKAILFDLDGTLLPLDQDLFIKTYLKALAMKLAPYGYEPESLVASILKGTDAMLANDGKRINAEVFWDRFSEITGKDTRADEWMFEDFYKNEFQNVSKITSVDPDAVSLVKHLGDIGVRCVLATNPVFPAIATESRIRWAGLEPSDFELYTTYENIGYAKPNLDYYRDIIARLGLDATECLMVGNDIDDDMVAEAIGMDVFLLTDNLINRKGKDISNYHRGNFRVLRDFLDTDAG